jgi:MFS family permease
MRQIAGNEYLRTVAMWAAAVNMVATGMMLMVVVLARYRGAGPATIGAVSATFALGGLAGALLAPRLIARFSSRRLVLIASWLLAPCPVGMALAPSPWLIGVTGALSVCAIAPVNVILLTRVAELTPHRTQGQTGNAMLLIGSSLKWPAPAVFGALADRFGPVTAVLIGAGLYTATAVWLQGRSALQQLDAPVPEPVGEPA